MLTPSPEDRSATDHHVANVHPYAELILAILRHFLVRLPKACWTSTAHWTASTTLGNSASTLSPAVFAMRPRCSPMSRSIISL